MGKYEANIYDRSIPGLWRASQMPIFQVFWICRRECSLQFYRRWLICAQS